MELIPIAEWSEGQSRRGIPKYRQGRMLGCKDETEIFKLLREPDHVAVNPVTNEVWRKRKPKVRGGEK